MHNNDDNNNSNKNTGLFGKIKDINNRKINNRKKLLNLIEIRNEINIIGVTAVIESELTYETNPLYHTENMQYVMQLPENMVIYEFKVDIHNNRKINSKCINISENDNNTNKYLYPNNIFKLFFKNKIFPPKTKIVLIFKMVTELKSIYNATSDYCMQLLLPYAFNPKLNYRYIFSVATQVNFSNYITSIIRKGYKKEREIIPENKEQISFYEWENPEGNWEILVNFTQIPQVICESGLTNYQVIKKK